MFLSIFFNLYYQKKQSRLVRSELLEKHFPELDKSKIALLEKFVQHISEWNEKINLISRKDIDNLWERHILHSLMILKVIDFKGGTKVLDLGTGGGFPGIPLAICFPDTEFHLIDARAKKIKVINEFIDKYDLKNVKAEHIRIEELKAKYDFIVSRAVTTLTKLRAWTRRSFKERDNNALPNGLIILKGGNPKDLQNELSHDYLEFFDIHRVLDDEYYKEKYVIYIQN